MDPKELMSKPQRLAPGHRSCAGCAFPIIARNVLRAVDNPVVVGNATGCMEVTTTIYPYTSWNVPFIHSAFENVAATMSGVEAAYKALKKKGEIKKDVKFVAFGGDGGTYDIGLQSLSGMLERGHNILYVCYNNEAYANTGVQRSSATPLGAATTTTPAGKAHPGKEIVQKDLTKLITAHNIPYVAQAAVHNWQDLIMKAKKGFEAEGPAFINVLSPCIPSWKIKPNETIDISKKAVMSRFWPLYEVEDGEYSLSFRVDNPIPVKEFLNPQGRFKHLFTPENKHIIDKIQAHVDKEWDKLMRLCSEMQ